jgi:2-hydroxycyclohexanecarboxyl-CoA dehydrogenase
MGQLQNKRIIVTGAGQGLGNAVVTAVRDEGAHVLATDLPDHPGLAGWHDSQNVATVGADLAEPQGISTVVAGAEDSLGGIDGLVACHAYMAMGDFLEQDPRTFWRHLDVNLRATFQLVQGVLPYLRAAGGGRIVFIGSEAGTVGMKGGAGYSASKAGLATLAKTMARELGPEGIITNVIAPSYVDTPQLAVDAAYGGITVDDVKSQAAASIPMGRIATPAEISRSVVYLLGPFGGATIGQVLNTNGGSFRGRV